MNIEDKLKDELDREGRRPVDVDALFAATRERLDSGSGRRRMRPLLAVAASAVAVLGIAGGGLWLDDNWQGENAGPGEVAGRPQVTEGDVDEHFTCQDTTAVGGGLWDPINVNRPGLGWKGVERYTFVPNGDTGVLRVGPADKTLTAKIHLRKQDRWEVERVRHCTGPEGGDVPVDGRFELGEHGRSFPEPPKFQADDGEPPPDSSVQPIDDRAFYNEFGVVDRRTVFAYEDGNGVKVLATGGELDYYEYAGYRRLGDGRFAALEPEFLYDVPGVGQQRDRDFVFAGYYTTGSATLTAELQDGSTVDAEEIRGNDWDGTLYALLAPRDQVEQVVVEQGGKTQSYQPDQL